MVLTISVLFMFSCRSVVNIADNEFRNHLHRNECIDFDNDGNIYITKAGKELTMLDCSNMQIRSLEGIENFVNLEVLKCQNNKLKRLNLTKTHACKY